jgi:hypothetical protein
MDKNFVWEEEQDNADVRRQKVEVSKKAEARTPDGLLIASTFCT